MTTHTIGAMASDPEASENLAITVRIGHFGSVVMEQDTGEGGTDFIAVHPDYVDRLCALLQEAKAHTQKADPHDHPQ